MKANSLKEAIRVIYHESVEVTSRRPIGGGDINDAYELRLSNGEHIFMKSNSAANLPFFTAEVRGLEAIRATGAIGTPEVLGYGTDTGVGAFLLLSFIEPGARIPDYWETFGHELAAMHQVPQTSYGFAEDNFIGATHQKNAPRETFLDFFRDCRLAPQFQMADHYFSSGDRKQAQKLLDHMDRFYIEPDHPSLVHGDLWSGNHMTGTDGKAWLIDPATYVGHPEADLAMTELFGRCPQSFYDAYAEAAPMQPGYRERKDFYNIYQLLNHLNLFGVSYLSSVRAILSRV